MVLQENLTIAGRFRLVRMIGRGGMGSVWQAVQLALDQPCALKFIDEEVGNLADAHARFEREAKAAAALRSPHVVQILDHGVWNGRPYIAMELLEGEELGKAMTGAGGKLPLPRINLIVQQVCRALTKAHQAGFVHRELKPDNIFLVNDDDRQLVKILDFGVAKQTSLAVDSNTKTGAMLGTPYYMSPEQAQGIKSVDSRSDLWSLAVIVYQCVTGQRPFDSEALGDLLVKIIVQPVPIPSQVAQVPPGFDQWWARAAERNPDNRFATAKDFASSLAIALGVEEDPNTDPSMRAQQPLQGTAMMHNVAPASPQATTGSNAYANVGAPPQSPQAYTAAFVSTPAPVSHGSHGTPPDQQLGLGGTGNPATFSPPITIPKSAPYAIIAAVIAGVVMLGAIGAGVFFTRRASSSGSSEPAPTASTALPSASLSASAEPVPTSSVAAVASSETPPTTPEPAPTGVVANSSAAATSKLAPPKASHGPAPTPLVPPPTVKASQPAASASTRKSTMGDDRKW